MHLTYITPDGTRYEREAAPGETVMEVAVRTSVPGILGDCGGSCACATCHVYIPEEWEVRLPKIEVHESEMLDVVGERQDNSRLGCQIKLTEELDGLEVYVPEEFF